MTLSIAECAAKWTEAEVSRSHSEACRWDCAPTALASSGTARAQQMADALGVDVTTVHNLAKAESMYLYLYSWDAQKAILARAIHSYIRFEAVWRKYARYELSPVECLEYLNADLSNDAMEAQIEDIHNPRPSFQRRYEDKRFIKKLGDIATEPSPEQPWLITRIAAIFKRAIERTL